MPSLFVFFFSPPTVTKVRENAEKIFDALVASGEHSQMLNPSMKKMVSAAAQFHDLPPFSHPLQVYKNCTEKNNQRLTTGTAALALMASLDIVTASTMTLSKTSAIEGVALRRNEKKNKKKNKNKTIHSLWQLPNYWYHVLNETIHLRPNTYPKNFFRSNSLYHFQYRIQQSK